MDRDGAVMPEKLKPVFVPKPAMPAQPATGLHLPEGPGKPEPAASPAGTGETDSNGP